MEVEILQAGSGKSIATLSELSASATVYDVKKKIHKLRRYLYPERQALKLEMRGKTLEDELKLGAIDFKGNLKLYVKDLGPQVGWKTVFLVEYAGPLVLYLITYNRPALFYGMASSVRRMHLVVHVAVACWVFHYGKRLLETIFLHRFSHATMPVRNIFKNCSYYWLFGLYIGYYINHPLYTPPAFGKAQMYAALIVFLLSEVGNLSVHGALRNLRPEGTKDRRIPFPTGNPFTWLFNLVSCPNYTYEVLAWISFSIMTQTLPAAMFAAAGFYQMTVWALGKHRNYKKEFPDYPKSRKAIIPFIL